MTSLSFQVMEFCSVFMSSTVANPFHTLGQSSWERDGGNGSASPGGVGGVGCGAEV